MKKSVTLSLVGSAIFVCLASTSGQAAVTGVQSVAPAAAHDAMITKAAWWWHRRHCWWRHHHRYCR